MYAGFPDAKKAGVQGPSLLPPFHRLKVGFRRAQHRSAERDIDCNKSPSARKISVDRGLPTRWTELVPSVRLNVQGS
jgi:hypothetical protein